MKLQEQILWSLDNVLFVLPYQSGKEDFSSVIACDLLQSTCISFIFLFALCLCALKKFIFLSLIISFITLRAIKWVGELWITILTTLKLNKEMEDLIQEMGNTGADKKQDKSYNWLWDSNIWRLPQDQISSLISFTF